MAKKAETVVKKAAVKQTEYLVMEAGEQGPAPEPAVAVDAAELRRKHIEELAFALAEQRGFEAGRELEDWLTAEAMVDQARTDQTGQ